MLNHQQKIIVVLGVVIALFFVVKNVDAFTVDTIDGNRIYWSGATPNDCTVNNCIITFYDQNDEWTNSASADYVTYSCAEAPVWGGSNASGDADVTLYNVGGGTCGYRTLTLQGTWHAVLYRADGPAGADLAEMQGMSYYVDVATIEYGGGTPPEESLGVFGNATTTVGELQYVNVGIVTLVTIAFFGLMRLIFI